MKHPQTAASPAAARRACPVAMIMAALVMALCLLPPARARAEEREIGIPVAGGELKGTLMVPDGLGGRLAPAILMFSGSGPTDRDGNGPTQRSDDLRMLAQSLTAKGIASLRFDKRGVAQSKGALAREEDVRVDTFVTDGQAVLETLQQQPGIGPVFLLGHSEGGVVATLLAQRSPVSGLILIAAPGRPIGDLIRQQLTRTEEPKEVQTAAFAALDRLERGQTVGNVPPALSSLLRPSVQPYLMSLLPIDPAAELGRTQVATLVMQGTADLQVDMSDATRLTESRRGIRLVRLDGVNHVLKLAPLDDRQLNLSTYTDPAVAISPAVATAIVEFIRASTR